MQHWGWPSKTEAPNVQVAAARAAQTVGYRELYAVGSSHGTTGVWLPLLTVGSVRPDDMMVVAATCKTTRSPSNDVMAVTGHNGQQKSAVLVHTTADNAHYVK
jgi:MOSC domain-containing protein YiiM